MHKERKRCGGMIFMVILSEAEKRDGEGGLWRWTGT